MDIIITRRLQVNKPFNNQMMLTCNRTARAVNIQLTFWNAEKERKGPMNHVWERARAEYRPANTFLYSWIFHSIHNQEAFWGDSENSWSTSSQHWIVVNLQIRYFCKSIILLKSIITIFIFSIQPIVLINWCTRSTELHRLWYISHIIAVTKCKYNIKKMNKTRPLGCYSCATFTGMILMPLLLQWSSTFSGSGPTYSILKACGPLIWPLNTVPGSDGWAVCIFRICLF